MPLASLTSVPISPVRSHPAQSLGMSTVSTSAYASGSWARSQRSLGNVKPSSARLPTARRRPSSPSLARIASHSAVVRVSHQRMAGRTGRLATSRRTAECIWPVSPRARTAPARAPSAAVSARSARPSARSKSAGSCSAQPGCGVERGIVLSSPRPRCGRPCRSVDGDGLEAARCRRRLPTSNPIAHSPRDLELHAGGALLHQVERPRGSSSMGMASWRSRSTFTRPFSISLKARS